VLVRRWSDVDDGRRRALATDNWTEFGFTTPTQGGAVTGSGTLLVTFDAGHDWNAVRFLRSSPKNPNPRRCR
jgi:photosystem II stability/assembly factor-like uncharacterized protein